MSTPLATPVPTVAPTVPAAPSAARASGGWLLGPILDSLFIANLAWPAVAAFAMLATQTVAYQTFGYLLAYFIIMPHRWITLPLVFGDRQRLDQRPLAYLAVLAAVVVSCGVVKLSMASLAVLVAADYLWNAWHFAGQHGGIYRIYGRISGQPAAAPEWEKWLLRGFFLFVLIRLTGTFIPANSQPWLDAIAAAGPYLAWIDGAALAVAAWFVVREGLRLRHGSLAGFLYLASICTLYCTLLLAIRFDARPLVLGCALATTLVHSSEYLAIVSWHAPKNRSLQDSALFRPLLSHWLLTLVGFMSIFAITTALLVGALPLDVAVDQPECVVSALRIRRHDLETAQEGDVRSRPQARDTSRPRCVPAAKLCAVAKLRAVVRLRAVVKQRADCKAVPVAALRGGVHYDQKRSNLGARLDAMDAQPRSVAAAGSGQHRGSDWPPVAL